MAGLVPAIQSLNRTNPWMPGVRPGNDKRENGVEGNMKVGFIGLGMMGKGMAANLQKAGHQLTVHDLNRAAAEPFLAKGAVWANSPRQVAEASEVVFTSLPVPADVEAVALGPNGLIEGMKPDTAFFDMSTNSVAVVRKINAAFAEKNLYMLDSPVSGGPGGAASGKMAIWVGGDEQQFNRHKKVLDAIGDAARYIGPIGAGSVAKLVHNCAGYAIQTCLAEVFTMGVKAGVEPLALWEAVRQGAGGRRRTFDALGDHFLTDSYDPPDFALRLAHKDVTLATELARELKVPMPMANLAHGELTAALNRGWEGRDSRVAMNLQKERAGVTIKVDPADIKAALERDGK
jgi:3-hydroxyisobutyrate dehydrogenase